MVTYKINTGWPYKVLKDAHILICMTIKRYLYIIPMCNDYRPCLDVDDHQLAVKHRLNLPLGGRNGLARSNADASSSLYSSEVRCSQDDSGRQLTYTSLQAWVFSFSLE